MGTRWRSTPCSSLRSKKRNSRRGPLARPLPAGAHPPLADRSAPDAVVEPNQKDAVELEVKLGLRGIFEVAGPSVGHREIAVDRDRLVVALIGARFVLGLEPGSDDREPATHRFVEGMVFIGGVLGEEVADRVRVISLPGPDVG